MYSKQIALLCTFIAVMNGYAFDESEGQLQFRDLSPAEEQHMERLGQACDEFMQYHPQHNPDDASFNQRMQVLEEQLSTLEKHIAENNLRIQTVNNRLDTADQILKFFILPMGASTIAAAVAFETTEWYNKKYQKALNKYVIAVTAGFSTAAIIYLAVWSASK